MLKDITANCTLELIERVGIYLFILFESSEHKTLSFWRMRKSIHVKHSVFYICDQRSTNEDQNNKKKKTNKKEKNFSSNVRFVRMHTTRTHLHSQQKNHLEVEHMDSSMTLVCSVCMCLLLFQYTISIHPCISNEICTCTHTHSSLQKKKNQKKISFEFFFHFVVAYIAIPWYKHLSTHRIELLNRFLFHFFQCPNARERVMTTAKPLFLCFFNLNYGISYVSWRIFFFFSRVFSSSSFFYFSYSFNFKNDISVFSHKHSHFRPIHIAIEFILLKMFEDFFFSRFAILISSEIYKSKRT